MVSGELCAASVFPCGVTDGMGVVDSAHVIPVVIAFELFSVTGPAVQINQAEGTGMNPAQLIVIIIALECVSVDFCIFAIDNTLPGGEPASFVEVIESFVIVLPADGL